MWYVLYVNQYQYRLSELYDLNYYAECGDMISFLRRIFYECEATASGDNTITYTSTAFEVGYMPGKQMEV